MVLLTKINIFMKIIKSFKLFENTPGEDIQFKRDKERTERRNKENIQSDWLANHPLEFKLMDREFVCTSLDSYKNTEGYDVFRVHFGNDRFIIADCKNNTVHIWCELGPRNYSFDKSIDDVEGLEELKTWLHKAMIHLGFNMHYYHKVLTGVEKCLTDRERKITL